jgi:excisionase family DNA binding protein
MGRTKNVLTTGEVARICNVAPRTVSKWFDSGHLHGYRIPGSKDRRIPRDQLLRFMRAHGIPLNGLDSGRLRVLLVDSDQTLCDALRAALDQDGRFEIATADSAFEAGAAACELNPHVVLVDLSLPDVNARAISRFFRGSADRQSTRLIGTGRGLTDAAGQALLQDGFDGYLRKPFHMRSLIELIDGSPAEVASSKTE